MSLVKTNTTYEQVVYVRDHNSRSPTIDELFDIMLLTNIDAPRSYNIEIPVGFAAISERQYSRLSANLKCFFIPQSVEFKKNNNAA